MSDVCESRPCVSAFSRRALVVAGWIVFLIPFVVHIVAVARYTPNVPYLDDFDAVLGTIGTWATSTDVRDRCQALWLQQNEHRIVIVRLLMLADYRVFGHVNFRRLAIYGNLMWVAVVALLAWHIHRRLGASIWELVPIPYVLFTSSHGDNFLWATSSIQNYGVLLIAVTFIECLAVGRDRPLHLLFPLALFTSGGGLPLLPLGIGELIRLRRWRSAILFAVTGGLALAIYFAGYSRPEHHPSPIESLSDPVRAGLFFLAFLGSVSWNLPLAASLGAVTLAGLAVGVFRHWSERCLCLMAGFVLLAATAAAAGRSGLGAEIGMSGRYAVYHQVAWVVIYGFGLLGLTGSPWRGRAVTVCIVAAAALYIWKTPPDLLAGGRFERENWQRTIGMLAFQHGHAGLLTYPRPEVSIARLQEAQRLGTYDFATAVRPKTPRELERAGLEQFSTSLGSLRIVNVNTEPNGSIPGWAVLTGVTRGRSELSLALDGGDGRVFVLPLRQIDEGRDFQPRNPGATIRDVALQAYFPEYALPEADYTAGILHESAGSRSVMWTSLVVAVRDSRVDRNRR